MVREGLQNEILSRLLQATCMHDAHQVLMKRSKSCRAEKRTTCSLPHCFNAIVMSMAASDVEAPRL